VPHLILISKTFNVLGAFGITVRIHMLSLLQGLTSLKFLSVNNKKDEQYPSFCHLPCSVSY
jgi:hypothetical protein